MIIDSSGGLPPPQTLDIKLEKGADSTLDNNKQKYNGDIAKGTEDTVEIQNSSQRSIEANQHSNEIRDTDEAKKVVNEVVELINLENGKSSGEQVHNLNATSQFY